MLDVPPSATSQKRVRQQCTKLVITEAIDLGQRVRPYASRHLNNNKFDFLSVKESVTHQVSYHKVQDGTSNRHHSVDLSSCIDGTLCVLSLTHTGIDLACRARQTTIFLHGVYHEEVGCMVVGFVASSQV